MSRGKVMREKRENGLFLVFDVHFSDFQLDVVINTVANMIVAALKEAVAPKKVY